MNFEADGEEDGKGDQCTLFDLILTGQSAEDVWDDDSAYLEMLAKEVGVLVLDPILFCD